ncbi:MAG: cbb3-type cytochrome c oxidase subunit 3 [Pseudomonadales bacterium]|jgi:cytochrome c oxidase cbb3-type subunit 4|nr:cbb3-type cytochrome c oxidase subunit 3 [Pseudomonadales bacterium]MBP9035748.1 cbb3-type cytochrome c oxidase subunit 3 [Pseudomonadales bacterium]
MDRGDLLGIGTVLAMIAFLGVCAWAWSGKRKQRFDEAARLPFADDDLDGTKKGGTDD